MRFAWRLVGSTIEHAVTLDARLVKTPTT